MKNLKLLTVAFFAAATVSSSFAQDNLGASCGCPPVSARTETVNLSTNVSLTKDTTVTFLGVANTYRVLKNNNTVLTCDKKYLLEGKLYVINGQTLTVMPGTVVHVAYNSPTAANTLIIAVGGKLIADGTKECPIVFTEGPSTGVTGDLMDGNYPMCNYGRWGGIVMLGRAKNNLTTANNSCANFGLLTPAPPSTSQKVAGIGFIEGYGGPNAFNIYGKVKDAVAGLVATEFDDYDNSGILKYVQIKASGATYSTANEINGLTLGSVGRGTTIDHIEIIANDDDAIEFFGGTVNVKNIIAWWPNDDMFDWDQGWKGYGQFLFGIQAGANARAVKKGADSAFESDGDDQDISAPDGDQSHPVIMNATFIGDSIMPTHGGPTGPSAIRAKEGGQGEIYNSIFYRWKFGLDMNNKTVRPGNDDAYNNWLAGKWIVKSNDFVNIWGGMGPVTFSNYSAGPPATFTRVQGSPSDTLKLYNDKNRWRFANNALPGFFANDTLLICTGAGSITDKVDAQPNPERKNDLTPIPSGLYPFFKTANYRGAFTVPDGSWMEGWSYGIQDHITLGILSGKGDVNKSGNVDASDLNEVLNNWGANYKK